MTRLLSTAATRNDIGQNPPEAHCSEAWTACLIPRISSIGGGDYLYNYRPPEKYFPGQTDAVLKTASVYVEKTFLGSYTCKQDQAFK